MEVGVIKSICMSEKKGTAKKPVDHAVIIENYGMEGDAHGGSPVRQISIIPIEKVRDFCANHYPVEDGAFGENLIVDGIDFMKYPLGTRFRSGEVVLELSQIGKECHSGCRIKQEVGYCIMPTEGMFFRVIHGGTLKIGDEITV